MGKCVSQESKKKEREFVWGVTTVLDSQFFGMNNKHREKKKSMEMEQLWRVNYRAYVEYNNEELRFQA